MNFVEFYPILAQCNPPPAETCEDASIFCSLDEMNGYSCNNPSKTPSALRPGCAYCCPPGLNRTWWAFLSQGGNVTITLNVGTCTNIPPGTGLVWGIFGDCQCVDEVKCIPGCIQPNQSETYQFNLKPCKIYYLFVEACANNICDFTLNTSGGGPPPLSLGYINNISSGIIEPVCVGFCNFKLFVNPPPNGCLATYLWTLDGKELPDNNSEIKLDFPDQGDFIICVTAYLGNPKSGSICTQEGPKCATVKVRPLPDRNGLPRILCYETANLGIYQWHSQTITTSGTYRERFSDNNCCLYDSVVEFTILPEIEPTKVLYLSCDNQPYVDLFGFHYPVCTENAFISLPKSTDSYRCDSAIILTSINVGLIQQWSAQCLGPKVELSPNLKIIDTCNFKTTHIINYKWYKKADTTKTALANTEQLVVDTINTDYCLDIGVKVLLGSDSATCVKTICENINEAKSGAINVTTIMDFCDSAFVDGKTYIQSTTLTQKLKGVFGCDSVINTEININKSSQTAIILIGCDSLIVNGQIYRQSTSLTQNLKTTNGCDSTIISDLVITKSSKSMMSLQGCDSLVINNHVYYQSGLFTQKLINSQNCDSLINLDLKISKSSSAYIKISGCDSLVIAGKVYYQSGLFPLQYQSTDNCDSLVNLDLTIFKTQKDSLSFSDCDTVIYNGKIYTQTGDYPEFYTSVNGCDSIVNVHINITNSNTSPVTLSKCDSVTINGKYYDQSGSYTQNLISANGCDSTLNIDLTIGNKTFSTYNYTHCDSAIINGKLYYLSGNYTQTIKNSNQCDSTIDIDLSITKSTIGDTIFRSCDSVIINGITFRQTGIYKQTFVNSIQCDSTLIIDFTRLSKSSTNLMYTSCDSISVNGIFYSKSGLYSQLLSNVNQCDSLLNLEININKSNSELISQTGCDSISVNGKVYYKTGHYSQDLSNTDKCDSSLSIDLTINKSSVLNASLKACDSIRIGTKVYTQSTNLIQFLKNEHQCDSTVNTQIQIDKSIQNSIVQSGCDSIRVNGNVYYISGQYTQHLQSSAGCDSMLHLDLSIKPGNPSTLDAGVDTSICEGDNIKLNGVFSGQANFNWFSNFGIFNNPNNLFTSYYANTIGFDKIYLEAKDDCKQWLDSFNIQILPRQIVQVTGDTLINPCKEITFTASGGTKYTWTPSSYIECLDPPCSRVLLKSSLDTRFTISTDGPCAVPANLNLSLAQIQTEVWLPNAFSPNSDNINDVFLPVFNCEQVDFYDLQIFDRWGNLIFQSLNKDKGWNGKYQDQNMNPGVYPYVIKYQIHGSERKVKAGDVTLVR